MFNDKNIQNNLIYINVTNTNKYLDLIFIKFNLIIIILWRSYINLSWLR
jgi:hypothetical protein